MPTETDKPKKTREVVQHQVVIERRANDLSYWIDMPVAFPEEPEGFADAAVAEQFVEDQVRSGAFPAGTYRVTMKMRPAFTIEVESKTVNATTRKPA